LKEASESAHASHFPSHVWPLLSRREAGWLTALRLGASGLLADRGDDEALASFLLYQLAVSRSNSLHQWPTAARLADAAAPLRATDLSLLSDEESRRVCEALGADLLAAVAEDLGSRRRGAPDTHTASGRVLRLQREGGLGRLLLEPLDGS